MDLKIDGYNDVTISQRGLRSLPGAIPKSPRLEGWRRQEDFTYLQGGVSFSPWSRHKHLLTADKFGAVGNYASKLPSLQRQSHPFFSLRIYGTPSILFPACSPTNTTCLSKLAEDSPRDLGVSLPRNTACRYAIRRHKSRVHLHRVIAARAWICLRLLVWLKGIIGMEDIDGEIHLGRGVSGLDENDRHDYVLSPNPSEMKANVLA